jgi:ribonuclease HII
MSERIIIGIDECGRGALAGPLVTCALVDVELLRTIPMLRDSKALTAQQREVIAKTIRSGGVPYIIDEASLDEIESKNILQANVASMNRSAKRVVEQIGYAEQPDDIELYIDGNYFHSSPYRFQTFVKGDALYPVISAASIMAKVYRDTYMVTIAHEQFPYYGFNKHKGYGTETHRNALLRHGPSPLHRPSFLMKIFHQQETLF